MRESSAIRVLAVVNSLGFGGSERMLERLVLRLSEAGKVRYTVCSLEDEGPIGARLGKSGIEVISLGLHGQGMRIVWGAVRAIRRILRSREFDLIHSTLYRSHCASRLARLGLSPKVPLLSSERCLGHNRGLAIRLVNRLMSPMSDRILAVSEAVAEQVIQRDRVHPDRVAVVPNGVELLQPSSRARIRLRRALAIDGSEVVFLFLGRIHREKGPDVLIEALTHLHRDGVNGWRALLVGDGGERPALSRLVKERGLQRVVFMSGTRRRVQPWLDASDVLVIPSREEGMPVAALEAMMYSRPIIASRVGGAPEVVREGETGILVPPEDSLALAQAMRRLLEAPAIREQMGTSGLRLVQSEFTIDRMASGTLRQYELVISGHRRGEDHGSSELLARAE